MNLVCLLAILIIYIGRSTEGASRPAVVNIGAMFAVSTINGGISKIAIKAAEEDVNADPSILSGTKFSVSMHDSNYSGFLSIIGALNYMESDTVAIIGPQTSVMAHIVSHLANELHVPLLSFTALDPTLSSLQYPYFLQTAPNDQFQMNAIGDMVSYFGWKEVVALLTDDDQSRNGVTALGDKLAQNSWQAVAGKHIANQHDRSHWSTGFSFRQIGYWSNNSGLSVVPPETAPNRSSSNQHLAAVVWPGGTTDKPRGWVFPNNGKQLIIGIPDRVSYRDFVSRQNGTDIAKGYCIDIFLAAIKLLPYAVPHRFELFGDGHKNPSYYELVSNIPSGKFDAAVGDIAIVANRTKIVDFTQPFIESGLVVVAPVRGSDARAWAFLKPFSPLMWGVTAAFFLIVGSVLWVLEHRSNDDFRGPPRKQIGTILWFIFSTMFFAHRENTVSLLGRMVLIIWLFIILIINSSYTASLTSMLTVQQLSSPITGIDTLISSFEPIGFQVGPFAENYLIEELNIPKSRLVPLGSPEEYANALKERTVAAVVDERPYIELFLSDNCMFSIRGTEFTKSGWGFWERRGKATYTQEDIDVVRNEWAKFMVKTYM